MQFFISCPIHFENDLAAEITEFWPELIDLDGLPTRAPQPEFVLHKGGIEIDCELHLGLQINFFSKVANRVLLRIFRFEARYYDQFEKHLRQFQWLSYLNAGQPVRLKIESHKSRLNNEKNLLEAAQRSLQSCGLTLQEESLQIIFIRLEKDRVQISLDTSGEHLHRRGYAVCRGEAPLRETLAALVVRQLNRAAGTFSERLLIDPFAGSGTLLFEALSAHRPNLNRAYSGLQFKKCPKIFQSASWQKNYRWQQSLSTAEVIAVDLETENIRKNIETFKKTFDWQDVNMKILQLSSAELDLTQLNPQKKPVWLIANPPYGVRLNEDDAKLILQKLVAQAEGLVVLQPLHWRLDLKNHRVFESQDFSNQGLQLKLVTYVKDQSPHLN